MQRQRGVMAVTFPLVLIGALAIGALAVDIGHLYAVRAELQTAADAAALAGAASLLPGNATGPNWTAAQAVAASAVGLNTSDGIHLHDASVQTGYWNTAGSPSSLQAQSIVPGSHDTAAVQVTVSRAPGLNGGPVSYFLAPLFGLNDGPVSATAVAMVSAPGSVAPGGLFPMAIGTCIYNQYWNAQTGEPQIDPSTGSAYTIYFGAGSSVNGCQTGQWTSFQTDRNDVPTVRGLIKNGNPTSLNIGDSIWVEPGVKTTIYSSVPTNVDVLLPIVNDATASTQLIVGFAAFHIDPPAGKNPKYIQGHFIAGYKITTAGDAQVGPYYGAYIPPRLAH